MNIKWDEHLLTASCVPAQGLDVVIQGCQYQMRQCQQHIQPFLLRSLYFYYSFNVLNFVLSSATDYGYNITIT